MTKALELKNKKFGRLTVLERVENSKQGLSKWLCQCECGNTKIALGRELVKGKVLSCGCFRLEKLREKKCIHKQTKTKLHFVWSAIKARCYRVSHPSYKNYGARGIKMHNEWKENFLSFSQWATMNGYKEGLTIDRIDVNGNYEPSNCRWVNRKIQGRNKRNNQLITYNGETHCISEWAEILGIDYYTLLKRINVYKHPIKKAFTNIDFRKYKE